MYLKTTLNKICSLQSSRVSVIYNIENTTRTFKWNAIRHLHTNSLTKIHAKKTNLAFNQCLTTHCRRYASSAEKHVIKSPYEDVVLPTSPLVELVWQNVDRWPDKTAIVCGITGRSYTYAQTRRMCRSFAASLLKQGFGKGDVLAVILPNIPEYPIALLGAIEAGMIVTTVNPIYTAEEISRQMIDSGAKGIVTFVEKYPIILEALKSMQGMGKNPFVIIADGHHGVPRGAIDLHEMTQENIDTSRVSKLAPQNSNDTVCLPYSSGTSGMPKGVMLTHENLIANIVQSMEPKISIVETTSKEFQDVILAVLPFYHIYGLELLLIDKLSLGTKIVTLPRFEPTSFLNAITAHKVTLLFMVPPLILFLGANPSVKPDDLDSLRYVTNGAAPIGAMDVERLKKKTPKTNFAQGYGLTETSPLISATMKGESRLATVGFLVPNTYGKIVDAETGDNLPSGIVGEICMKGPQMMKGYLNKTNATAEMIDESGWLHTGDLGYYEEDGAFYIVDRLKELIKVKGFQVAPTELEEILRSHPNIADAAVIGIPDERSGEIPRAYVVPKGSSKLTEDEVKHFVASKVSTYKKLQGVEFLTSIPRNPAGKILRRVLREIHAKQ